jgi:hypothetical protein
MPEMHNYAMAGTSPNVGAGVDPAEQQITTELNHFRPTSLILLYALSVAELCTAAAVGPFSPGEKSLTSFCLTIPISRPLTRFTYQRLIAASGRSTPTLPIFGQLTNHQRPNTESQLHPAR